MSSVNDFDFLLGSWNVENKRRTQPFLPASEGVWEAFSATANSRKELDGRVRFEQYDAYFPSGEHVQGLTIRAFDHTTAQWSIVWLDNRNAPDFTPLQGTFENGIGLFYQIIPSPIDNKLVHVRFTWDNITENTARWQQAFSFDEGQAWDTNWIMEHYRQK